MIRRLLLIMFARGCRVFTFGSQAQLRHIEYLNLCGKKGAHRQYYIMAAAVAEAVQVNPACCGGYDNRAVYAGQVVRRSQAQGHRGP